MAQCIGRDGIGRRRHRLGPDHRARWAPWRRVASCGACGKAVRV